MYADMLLFVEESHRAFTCIHFLALSVLLTQSHNVIVSPNKVNMCCIFTVAVWPAVVCSYVQHDLLSIIYTVCNAFNPN